MQILLYSDSERSGTMISALMRRQGHALHWSHDDSLDLDMIRQLQPDICILDITRSSDPAFALLFTLRCEPETASMPVIMLSDDSEARDVVEALELGANDYIRKPLHGSELLKRLDNLLRPDPGRARPA